MAWRKIGILGGMGPEATILLQQRLLAAVAAQDDADHIPLLIDMNPQVPSRIAHLIKGTGEDPGPTLARMAQALERGGATALAMPCNTAHHYAAAITAATQVPFINMIDLAADDAARALDPGGSVGLLASPGLRRTGLFERALSARGLKEVWPSDEAPLLSAIQEIKKSGPSRSAREALHAASEELLRKGATYQLIACSEFSLIAESAAKGARAVDTLDLLVEAVVLAARGEGA